MSDTFSVSELYEQLDDLFAATFGRETWIHGEIRNYTVAQSGHIYFDLADPSVAGRSAPSLSITLFRPQQRDVNAALLRHGSGVELGTGVAVRIAGTIGAYAPRSSLQMRMSAIDPTFTIGAIEQERERVLAVMTAEGLLDINGRLPLAELPLRVALITSVGSAAHADVLHELERWGIGFEVLQIDARTQGAEAVDSLVAGLRTAERLQPDVVMLVRGGGARTDLIAFDNERVARAIVAMTVPVFTGVGHEIDRTVVDDVAHTACKTPTACASAVGERAQHAVAQFEANAAAVPAAAQRLLNTTSSHLGDTAQRSARAAAAKLDHAAAMLDRTTDRVGPAVARALDGAAATVDLAAARVAGHDPQRALERGWSMTRHTDGRIVRSPDDAAAGDALVTTVAGGVITSTVTTSSTHQ
ncbi:MAG: exodeoxyribonuclease VII large subunit [Actinomycetes bacterium]